MLNPFSALASAMTNISNPYNSILGFIPFLGADLGMLRGDVITLSHIPRPLYHYSLPFYGMITIVFYFISSRLVIPTKKWVLSRKDILTFISAILILVGLTFTAYYITTDSYEQAVFDNPGAAFLPEPVFEEQIMRVEVAREVQPAIPVDVPDVQGLISIEQEISFHTTALIDFVETFSSERSQPLERLFLVSTIVDTEEDQSYTFLLPEPIQLAITDELSSLSENITWVDSTEAVFDNTEMDVGPGDYVIIIGDLDWLDDENFTLALTLNIQSAVERTIVYSFAMSDDGIWEIDSYEKVFDAAETN
jgi:hypothetical protein